MQRVGSAQRFVVGRENNLVLIDFRRPDPSVPFFLEPVACGPSRNPRTKGAACRDRAAATNSDGMAEGTVPPLATRLCSGIDRKLRPDWSRPGLPELRQQPGVPIQRHFFMED